MTGVLRTAASLSLSGSLVIAAILLLRPLVRGRVSARWQYYVWLVALARLLMPAAPEGSLMGTLFREAPASPAVVERQVLRREHDTGPYPPDEHRRRRQGAYQQFHGTPHTGPGDCPGL